MSEQVTWEVMKAIALGLEAHLVLGSPVHWVRHSVYTHVVASNVAHSFIISVRLLNVCVPLKLR